MLQIFVGFDSSNYGQKLAYEVCKRSIRKYNQNISIHKLVKKDLEQQKIFNRQDNTGATEFTYTRFLTPYLSEYKGWSLFCDSDFLWFCDPEEIILECIEKNKINQKAVYCVQHKYTECHGKEKMDGRKQEWYPKKNWSSLMIFNNSHPSIKNLSLENINNQTPKWLHRMEWCKEEEIGEVHKEYNYLVGYYNDNNYKALHFTDGGPWHPKYKNVEFGNLWLEYLMEEEKVKMLNKMKNIIVITPIKHLNNLENEFQKFSSVIYKPEINKNELSEFLKNNSDIEYIFTNPNKQGYILNKEVLHNSSIKVINTASTGLNHIDLEYCKEKKIEVWSLTKDYKLINDLPSTSELGFGLMINLLRKIPQSFESVKKFEWNYEPFVGRQIKGLTMGIIGFGRLGKIMANFCYSFGMSVLVYDPYVSDKDISKINENYEKVDIEELKSCDVISLHVHVTKETRHMINKHFIKNMKPFYLINTSRGEIVNEVDVIEGLKEGIILGYGTDVLETEFDTIKNNTLIKMSKEGYNIIITPHIGGMSIEGQNKAYMWATKKF